MKKMLAALIERMDDPRLASNKIIQWGSPVPAFGNLSSAAVATLGINPSNREFVNSKGHELDGNERRFQTLRSLGISKWSDATSSHLLSMENSCKNYFLYNPYNAWFKSLDNLISGTRTSYYGKKSTACHLDLIPYATSCKWTDLTSSQRTQLLSSTGDTLGLLLKDSKVQLLVLNGRTVIENLSKISDLEYKYRLMPTWSLPRSNGSVLGYSCRGVVTNICGIKLNREIVVLGLNHNIQSSFGVTSQVKESIRDWITLKGNEVLN